MSAPDMSPFGRYTTSEGEVLRNGIPLSIPTAERLQAAFSVDPEPYAQQLAKDLGAAIREAKAWSETEAA